MALDGRCCADLRVIRYLDYIEVDEGRDGIRIALAHCLVDLHRPLVELLIGVHLYRALKGISEFDPVAG